MNLRRKCADFSLTLKKQPPAKRVVLLIRAKPCVPRRRVKRAYNNFACLEKKSWKYLIRIKDHERKNAYGIKLPDEPELDLPVRMTLGRLTPQQLRQHDIPVPEHYYRLPNSVPFDYLDAESTDFYEFSARIVRLQLKGGRAQLLLTEMAANYF